MIQLTLKNNKTGESVQVSYSARDLVNHGGEEMLIENIIENNICNLNCSPVGETYANDCNCFEEWGDCTLIYPETQLDWELAKEQLYSAKKAYEEIGWGGIFALLMTINPLIKRFESGERTNELHDEIMSVEL